MGRRGFNPGNSTEGRFYAALAIGAAILVVAAETVYLILSGFPSFAEPSLDVTGDAIGRDFLVIWSAGRAVLGYGPANWLDPAVYNAALRVMLGPDLPEHFWAYPPHLMLFTWPLGLLPYLPAYVLWCALGMLLYLLVCAAALRGKYLLFLAAAPGVALCIFFGQSGFYIAALLIGGFALLDRWPIFAGVLFGLLSVQPHFIALLPFMLLLRRQWRAIAAAVVTIAALLAATHFQFGPQVWTDFFDKIIPQQREFLESGGRLLFMTGSSVFVAARAAGAPPDFAWVAQGLVSILAAAAVIWTYRRRRDPLLSFALFVTASFLASPYLFSHDMVVLGFVAAALRQRGDNTLTDHGLAVAIWSLPVTMLLFGAASIPIAPLVLMAFAGRLMWRLVHAQTQQRAPAVESRMEERSEPAATAPVVNGA